MIRGTGVWDSSVLSLLLYSNSVVLGSEFLSLFHGFAINARYDAGLDDEELREDIVHGFAQLAELRPLIDRDLVHFTNIVAMPYAYRDYLEGDDYEQRVDVQRGLSRMWTGGREFTVISASTALAALFASPVPVSFESGAGAGLLGAAVGRLFDNRAARRARRKDLRDEELIGRLILGFLDNPDAAGNRVL